MLEIQNDANLESALTSAINADEEIIIIKNFADGQVCNDVVKDSHKLMRSLPNRVTDDECFFSFDVLPTKVETNRIMRTMELLSMDSKHTSQATKDLFTQMIAFQKKHIANDESWDPSVMKRRMQIMHYPQGGGYFDWHLHPRLPVNYGLILNLSEKGKNYNFGATEIVTSDGETKKVEDHCNIGDLILFRYDLKHRVAPCDPAEDLCFDTNGRWTAILPIF